MNVHYCGHVLPDFPWPDASEGACCWGTAADGPRGCTCWDPVHDLDQAAELRTDLEPATRAQMCGDCAYRPSSPERRGEAHVSGDQGLLDTLAVTGTPFWCHQGLRRVTSYVHPNGVTYAPDGPELDAAYDPPMRDGVPYKADGSPADLCAGWAARRRKHLATPESTR